MSVRDRIRRAEHGRTRIWALLLAFGTFATQLILLTPDLALADVPVATPDGYSVVQDGSLIVDWWDADWSKRRPIVFDNTLQGTDLDDFPVLVTIPPGFDYGQAQGGGQDLRFVDASGAPLSHEIEVWDVLGSSYVWVKVPRIDAGSTTDSIWMYYGNPLALDRQDKPGVWSNGYVGVWHFDEDPSGGAGSIKDSTSYANHGDPFNMDASNLQGGAIGTGLYFPGTTPNPDYIRVASSGVDELALSGTEVTLEAWVDRTGIPASHSIIVGRQLGSSWNDSYVLFGDATNPDMVTFIAGGYTMGSASSIPLNEWRYVAGVRDGAVQTVYSDGLQVGQITGVAAAIPTDANDVTFGAQENDASANPTEAWLGGIDEVRISDVARSADWVRAQNLSMTGALAALGLEQSAPAVDGVLGNDNDPEDDPLTAILVSPPGQALGFTFRADGTFVYTPNPGYSGPDSFDYKVDDGTGDSITVTAAITVVGGISGRVFEDIDGNLLAGAEAISDTANPIVVGATVHVYADDGTTPDAPDAGDTPVLGSPFTTGAAGIYTSGSLSDGKYWVVVDSTTVPASQEPTEPQANIWAEQTYGWIGALCADGAGGTAGPSPSNGCYGGRRADQSDSLTAWHSGAEHIASVIISGGFAVPNVDFGFSFNAVTSVDAATAPGVTGRTAQGSLDQFIRNANAIAGTNGMRFVPADAPNASGGSGSWWQIDFGPSVDPLAEIHDADTTIDGRAYDRADGITIRDLNTGFMGANEFGTATVGADDVALPQVARPELHLIGANLIGLEYPADSLVPHRMAVYRLAMTGSTGAMIRVNAFNGTAPIVSAPHVADTVLGSPPDAFSGSLPSGANQGVYFAAVDSAIIENNLIGWTDNRAVDLTNSTSSAVRGNELRETGEDVVDIFGTSNLATFENNLVYGGANWGLDYLATNGVIRNNTFESAGDGVGQSGGMRVYFEGNLVDRNVFLNNNGPGLMIAGEMIATPRDAGEAVITRNEFSGNTGPAIDLQIASEDNLLSGDGITANNGGVLDPIHGNDEIDFPEISGATLSGATTTVTGTACSGCTVEVFEAIGGTGDDDPPGSSTNYHGEGTVYLGSGVATGGAFSIDVTGLIVGDEVSATATDTVLAVTSEFALNETVVAINAIAGTVFHDIDGNLLSGAETINDAANPAVNGVDVWLYDDLGTADVPDAADTLRAGPIATAGAGDFSFAAIPDGTYWVVIDSQDLEANDKWAEQTYGPIGAWCADGGGGTAENGSAGACYGGRRANQSDDLTPWHSDAEHLARIVVSGAGVTKVDFGFSFNVVTTTRGGDATPDPGATGTQSVQGSLRQFITNANNLAGANAMRFVPAGPTNQTDGGGNDWWRISFTSGLPAIFDPFTTVDGTAYNLSDGTTMRDTNGATLGTGGTVGTDAVALGQVAGPELEVVGDRSFDFVNVLAAGDDFTLRRFSSWGFVRTVENYGDRLLVEDNVLGTSAASFTDPGAGLRQNSHHVYSLDAADGVIQNNILAYSDATGVAVYGALSTGWQLVGNEVRSNALANSSQDGFALHQGISGQTIEDNLLVDMAGFGIDMVGSAGSASIRNNTISGNGHGNGTPTQIGGIRLMGTGSLIEKNVLTAQEGPGIIVSGTDGSYPVETPAVNNRISQNSFTLNGTIGIDLEEGAGAHTTGDGVTLNDGGPNATFGNLGLDYPVIASAELSAGDFLVAGSSPAGAEIEFYISDGDVSGFGEGVTYLVSGVEGSGPDLNPAAGTFSFRFSPAPGAVSASDEVTALSIDASDNTSEFGPNVTVALPTASISGAVFEDVTGDVLPGAEAVGDASNPFTAGVDVYLFADDGATANVPDATDSMLYGGVPGVTDGSGAYDFSALADGTYWVVVDSGTVEPTAGYNGTFTVADVWAEQTYGASGAWCADGLGGTAEAGSAGSCYGGRDGATGDNSAALTSAEHIIRVQIAGGVPVSNIDFGFSFNILTNTNASTVSGISGRSAQGSFDQFVRNANAIAGANAMRFAPAVPQNDGTGSWWSIDYAPSADPLRRINDAGTVVDGRAYALSDGVTVVDSNSGFLGANAGGGLTVGVDDLALPQVAKPELEIVNEGIHLNVSGALVPAQTEIRGVSIWGALNSIDIGPGTIDDLVVEDNVIGSGPGAFVDPGGSGDWGITANSVSSTPASGGIIRNNLVGFLDRAGVNLENASDDWTISGNEVRNTGRVFTSYDTVLLWGAAATVTGNYLHTNSAYGIDNFYSGGHLIENNTIANNGLGGVQTAGIRLQSNASTVRRNIITGNTGPGIIVAWQASSTAVDNHLTDNVFGGNSGNAVDLVAFGGDSNMGDGISLNDGLTDPNDGNIGLDYPVITAASTAAVSGMTCANCSVEVYRAVSGAGDTSGGSDYGEGVEHVGSAVADAGGAWTAVVAGLAIDDEVSAIAIDATNNTSEFGVNATVNAPPVLDAVGDWSVDELALLSFVATASDPNGGDMLSFSLSGEPVGASITAGGVFSWTPTEAQGPGSYVFDVVVSDDGLPNLSDSESITVTVGEVNIAPVLGAVGDRSVAELNVLAFTATASDPDDPANLLTFSLSGAPVGASITAGGVFSWTPTEAQAPGSYVFDVVVTETNGSPANLSDSEAITVTVTEANTPPVLDAVGDWSVDELANLSFIATASDLDTPPNTLTFSLSGAPVGASITAGGAFSWTPTEAQGPGSYVFDVVVTETNGSPSNLSDSESITVTVGEVNLAPTLDAVGDRSVDELVSLSFTATASDPDDPANSLAFSLSGEPVGASITPGGAFSWTPTEVQGPGSYVFDVVVSETDGSPSNWSDSETITVTVGEVNVAPVLDPVGDRSVAELSALGFTATATDPDDPANLLSFSLSGAPAGATITAGGAFSWTPTEAQGPGPFTFDVVVTETNGSPSNLSDSETITVTVGEVDVAPVLDAVGDRSVDELVSLSFTATASDPDDPANSLAFSLSGAPSGASITPGGAFSWTPTEAQGPGSYVFDVVVTETDGSPSNLSDSETITVTVGEVNVAPVLAFVGNRAGDELVNLSFTASAADPDDPANNLVFSLSGAPAGASMTAGGVFSWTPTEAQGPGLVTFDVVVTETDGSPGNLSDSETITVTVGEDNLAPTLNPVGDQSINELNALSFTATAWDPDAPVNTLLFSLVGEPTGAIIDPNTGGFSWAPTEAQGPGSYTFAVVVTDDAIPGLNDSETITITVNEVNQAPVLDPVGDGSVDELVNLSFTATASDPDTPSNTLTFSLSGAPAGASITAGGVFSWTPTEAQGPGSYAFDVIVTETDGTPTNLTDTETITITVNETNTAPTASPIADAFVDEETLFSLVAVASDSDLPAETLSWSLESGPGTALANGSYIYTPTEADGPGAYPVTLRVTDSGSPARSDTVSFTVTVAEVNVPPAVSPSSFVVAEGGVLSPGPAAGVLAGASDAEGDTILALLDSPPAFGSLSLLADGSFTYTHDGSENHLDGFSFTATDTIDASAPTAVTITVDPVNDAPALTGTVFTPAEDTVPGTTLGSVTASDAEDDPLLFAFTAPNPVFTIGAITGEIGLAAPLDFETVPSYTLSVSVTDPSGATDVADVVVNVADIDELPVAASAVFPVVEDLPVGATVGVVSASDPEGEVVSFSITGGDPAGQFTIDPSSGELILVAPLDAGETPSYLLDVAVSDPGGNVAPAAIIVIVSPAALLPPVNAWPLGLADFITLDEDTTAIVAPLANDSDPDGDQLLVSWIDAPVNGTLTANGDGTYTYQPGPHFYGSETLSYGISDGRGGLSSSTVELVIASVNDPPVAPNVETVLEFAPRLEIPIPAGIYDPDGDAVRLAVGTPDIGLVTLADGVFVYAPRPQWNGTDTFTYRVVDAGGASSTGLVTVLVTQIDGGLVAIDLVSVEGIDLVSLEESESRPSVPSSGIVVDGIKLLVGPVAEMAGLLGIPLLAVGVAFLGSILFGLSRNFVIGRGPVFLPATAPGNMAVVRLPAGGVLTALEGPGDEYPVVHRFAPAETGIRATGRRAQRGATGWIEVETPEGDAWVVDRFLTPTVPTGLFAADDQVAATIDAMRGVVAERGDLTPLVSRHGLEVAYYASPKHFGEEDLGGLLAGDASWGWWDPTGSTPSVRGAFTAIVADPLVESVEGLDGRAVAEAVVEIPIELVNFAHLTFGEPDRLGWRVFFEYEDDEPKLAAIWREGVTNPAAI